MDIVIPVVIFLLAVTACICGVMALYYYLELKFPRSRRY